jgi:hypothetical protein
VFVILDTRAALVFCPTVPFSIKAARFHTDRVSSLIHWRHVQAAQRATTDISNDLLAADAGAFFFQCPGLDLLVGRTTAPVI